MNDRDLDNLDAPASQPQDQDRQDNPLTAPQPPSTTQSTGGEPQRKAPFVVRQNAFRQRCKQLRKQRTQGY
jgi:hypothetical protein